MTYVASDLVKKEQGYWGALEGLHLDELPGLLILFLLIGIV